MPERSDKQKGRCSHRRVSLRMQPTVPALCRRSFPQRDPPSKGSTMSSMSGSAPGSQKTSSVRVRCAAHRGMASQTVATLLARFGFCSAPPARLTTPAAARWSPSLTLFQLNPPPLPPSLSPSLSPSSLLRVANKAIEKLLTGTPAMSPRDELTTSGDALRLLSDS
jgi:hypothetical protein